MPRRYIIRDENNNQIDADWKTYAGGAGVGEAYVLGNTDFDAIYNPITAFNFVLEVEGIYFLPIKTVRAFTKENEFEYIREGGVNDYVHMKRKPISKPFTFQIERYVGTERFLDPLANGTELILPLILYVYRHRSRQGITASAPAWPARVYTFTGCTVMSKEYGELNAEKSGIITETTTIAYRELVVLTNGIQSISEENEWNPDEQKDQDGPGLTTKYAAYQPSDDKSKDTYVYDWVTEDGITRQKAREGSAYTFYKPAWDGTADGATWAKKSTPDEMDATYNVETVDGVPTVTRKDKSDYNRAPYEIKTDKAKAKYANQSPIDTNEGERVYEVKESGDGNKVSRIDHAQINKAAWDGAKGTKVSWATQSVPDKTDSTYTVTTKDGIQTVTRKDNSQFNVGAYDYATDKTRNKRSEVASVDKNAAAPIYKKKGSSFDRVDNAEMNKKPYSYAKDGENVKWAKESPKDHETPASKDPYEYGEENVEAKWARTSPTDSEKPEVKDPFLYDGTTTKPKWAQEPVNNDQRPVPMEPYQYGEKNVDNKWAKTSPKDSETVVDRPPYSVKADGATAKYAKTSPLDKPLATPVTWPPTRRALMAENLKK